MKPLQPLLHLAALAWWRWAQRELQQRDPHHPDLIPIVHRLNHLERTAP